MFLGKVDENKEAIQRAIMNEQKARYHFVLYFKCKWCIRRIV